MGIKDYSEILVRERVGGGAGVTNKVIVIITIYNGWTYTTCFACYCFFLQHRVTNFMCLTKDCTVSNVTMTQ